MVGRAHVPSDLNFLKHCGGAKLKARVSRRESLPDPRKLGCAQGSCWEAVCDCMSVLHVTWCVPGLERLVRMVGAVLVYQRSINTPLVIRYHPPSALGLFNRAFIVESEG